MKQLFRKRKIIIAIILVLLVYHFPLHHVILVAGPYLDFYTASEIGMLAFAGMPGDRIKAEPVLELAEEAFSDIESTREEREKKYGLLHRYGFANDYYTAASEKHSLKLWAAHFYGTEGYMWICYSSEVYDADGNITSGSQNVQALWKLEKIDGEWVVVHIKEHP